MAAISRTVLLLLVVSTLLPWTSGAEAAEAARGRLVGAASFTIPEWFKNSFLEFDQDTREAGERGRHVLVFMHLEGCPYCARMLRENFEGGPNQSFIKEHFDCIDINIRGDREVVFNNELTLTEKELASYIKVYHTPTILFLNQDNREVLRLNGYRDPGRFRTALEYVHSRSYREMTLSDYAAARSADSYVLAPHASFSETSYLKGLHKPLMVIFEDASCTTCADFHDRYLDDPDIRAQLEKLLVVRLDAASAQKVVDPAGRLTTARQWAQDLNLHYRPGIVFFDGARELTRIESGLNKYHFETALIWVAERKFQTIPNLRQFARQRENALLESGRDINVAF